MSMTVKKDNALIGFTIIFTMFAVGIYYLLPIIYVNPYEYLYGRELRSFQLYHLIFSGVMIPLLSLVTGLIISRQEYDKVTVLKRLSLVFLVLLGCSVLFNGFIILFVIPLSGMVVLFFRENSLIISLITAVILLVLYLVVWTIIPALTSVSTNDIIYSSIQQLNNYLGVYREKDIISMIELNVSSIRAMDFFSLFMFVSLPFTFIGSILERIDIEKYFKTKGFILTLVVLTSALFIKMIEVLSLGSRSGKLIGENIGGMMLGFALFLTIILLVEQAPKFATLLFEIPGKYVLFLFIVFNFLMSIIFYGIGFNYYGEVTVATLVLIIFIILIVLYAIMLILNKFKITLLEIFKSNR
ncbi:DUF418 domain-containing protein [Nosocomiicoccus ampullae]|uniref:DUF418 domain-containing protein n=1 Tax=Nosocomiicoccus ampullae TaxID=489910 RepID=UPI00255047A3|nr:DUF418 domain-containing protein [Nosocomiicoccus ampullae]MDK6863765.1 DUF418 domain-containing protein [Nosocomiicoccus ampullae]